PAGGQRRRRAPLLRFAQAPRLGDARRSPAQRAGGARRARDRARGGGAALKNVTKGRYAIGIDLGTTHSALSYFNLSDDAPRGRVQPVLPVPQLTGVATIEEQLLLPSFLYLPSPHEFPPNALSLPWDSDRKEVVGAFARSHGSKVPARLVSSAKSWLCHPGVDRTSALLPWQAPEEVHRISPLDASAKYLRYLREAWDHKLGGPGESGFSSQDVIVTVPASFDAAARELTL